MNDETPAILSDTPNTSARSTALGTLLSEARKTQGLNIEDVAQQLRMSARQISALEEENFAALSSPPFVRGFIRNYAKLLRLDAEPLLQAYREANPENSDHGTITLPSERIAIVSGSRKTWMTYLAGSFLVLLAGSGWWAYMEWRDSHPVAPVQAKISPEPPSAPAMPVVMPESSPEPAAQVSIEQSVAEPPSDTATQVETPAKTDIAAIQGSIHMTVSEQSWVSVTDSTGKEVFNKLKAAGTEDFADGTPPFSVVVGNASGVQLSFKNKPVDLAPHTRANVARLTLE